MGNSVDRGTAAAVSAGRGERQPSSESGEGANLAPGLRSQRQRAGGPLLGETLAVGASGRLSCGDWTVAPKGRMVRGFAAILQALGSCGSAGPFSSLLPPRRRFLPCSALQPLHYHSRSLYSYSSDPGTDSPKHTHPTPNPEVSLRASGHGWASRLCS